MLSQNLSTGHSGAPMMFENFVSISPTGVTLINFIMSNLNCLSLVMLNYLIVS